MTATPEASYPITLYSSQAYIDNLRRKLRAAEDELKIASSLEEQNRKTYDKALVWRDKLKIYWDNIQKTNELSEKVIQELDAFTAFVNKVGNNTGKTTDAIRILIYYTRATFRKVDYLKYLITDLLRLIEKPGKDELNKQESIMKCLYELHDRLNVALAAQTTTIHKTLNVFRANALLLAEMSGNPEKDGERYGLVNDLRELRGLFTNAAVKTDSKSRGCADDTRSCNAQLSSRPVFPLPKDKDNEYFRKTKEQYEKATQEFGRASADYKDAKARLEAATANRDSNKRALEAALKAKNGK